MLYLIWSYQPFLLSAVPMPGRQVWWLDLPHLSWSYKPWSWQNHYRLLKCKIKIFKKKNVYNVFIDWNVGETLVNLFHFSDLHGLESSEYIFVAVTQIWTNPLSILNWNMKWKWFVYTCMLLVFSQTKRSLIWCDRLYMVLPSSECILVAANMYLDNSLIKTEM